MSLADAIPPKVARRLSRQCRGRLLLYAIDNPPNVHHADTRPDTTVTSGDPMARAIPGLPDPPAVAPRPVFFPRFRRKIRARRRKGVAPRKRQDFGTKRDFSRRVNSNGGSPRATAISP